MSLIMIDKLLPVEVKKNQGTSALTVELLYTVFKGTYCDRTASHVSQVSGHVFLTSFPQASSKHHFLISLHPVSA